MIQCRVASCSERVYAHGVCRRCYDRMRYRGELVLNPRIKDPLKRIESRVTKDSDGCWIWRGYCLHSGEPVCQANGIKTLAARIVYECVHGPIPNGMTVRTKCQSILCLNPAHMMLGPCRQWMGKRTAVTRYCENGHRLDAASTHIHLDGSVSCRVCELNERIEHGDRPAETSQ